MIPVGVRRAAAIALLVLAGMPAGATEPPDLRDGDIALQRSMSSQSAALRAATGSPYTHVGLVFQRDGAWQVLEAVEPVRWTAWSRWADRGEADHVVIMRVRDPDHHAPETTSAVRRAAEAFLGLPYDTLFAWSDDRIYCSELVYKAWDRGAGLQLGTLRPLSDFDLSAEPVQALIAHRVRGDLDLSQPVVAPASLIADADLAVVYSNDPDIAVAAP